MRKIFFVLMILGAGSIVFTGCDPGANTNTNRANAVNNATTSAANPAAAEADIKKALADMSAALTKGDMAAIQKMYLDSSMFVGPDGKVTSKADRLASMQSGETKFDSISLDEITVRSNPEGTAAVSISSVMVKGKIMGTAVDAPHRVTHVWYKASDGWRMASSHASVLPTPQLSPQPTPRANANTNTNRNTNTNANP